MLMAKNFGGVLRHVRCCWESGLYVCVNFCHVSIVIIL